MFPRMSPRPRAWIFQGLIAAICFGSAACPGFSSELRRELSLPEYREKIETILDAEEFRGVHKPKLTAWERLKLKTLEFLQSLLARVFGASAFPKISKIIIWILAGAAVVMLAVWILRTLTRSAGLESANLPETASVSARPWQEWLTGAHEAAAAGNWREAVRLAYWSGISFLESGGLWPPDRARTPREYLRMLPDSNERRETLAALTRKFEITWYGGAQAGQETFSESLDCLERMGCRFS